MTSEKWADRSPPPPPPPNQDSHKKDVAFLLESQACKMDLNAAFSNVITFDYSQMFLS